jgi:hypothetical protein
MVNQQSKQFYKNGMLNNHNSQVTLTYFLIGYIEIRYLERSNFYLWVDALFFLSWIENQ